MRTRAFGNTGLTVSALGFGAGKIGDPATRESEIGALLNTALDLGITFIDTARSYGLSEERIGKHLHHRRPEFILSTKVGYGIPGIPDWTAPCIDRVLGLIAVGSMAVKDYLPDRWSDHDFFVIAQPGNQEFFRTDFSWLPSYDQIVFSYRETPHGVKILYRNGHLLEFAVFDLRELYLARVNRYRVLLDRCSLEEHLAEIRTTTVREAPTHSDDLYLVGQFLTNLLVGVGHHRRGEQLSGHFFVKQSALRHLALLVHKHVDSETKHLLDGLDPLRRFEFAFPDMGRELNRILELDTPETAKEMLSFAEKNLRGRLKDYPVLAVEVILRSLMS